MCIRDNQFVIRDDQFVCVKVMLLECECCQNTLKMTHF